MPHSVEEAAGGVDTLRGTSLGESASTTPKRASRPRTRTSVYVRQMQSCLLNTYTRMQCIDARV